MSLVCSLCGGKIIVEAVCSKHVHLLCIECRERFRLWRPDKEKLVDGEPHENWWKDKGM